MVQFYPWFKFYFPLFQTHYPILPYPNSLSNSLSYITILPQNKAKQNLDQGQN